MTASEFPGGLDSDANLLRRISTDAIVPADHNNLVDAIQAIEAFLGTLPAGWPVDAGEPRTVANQALAAASGGSGGGGSGGTTYERARVIPAAGYLTAENMRGGLYDLVQTAGGWRLGGKDAADSFAFAGVARPSAPYSLVVRLRPVGIGQPITTWGVGAYTQAGGQGRVLTSYYFNGWQTSLGVLSGNNVSANEWSVGGELENPWLALSDDGTHVTWYVSEDGDGWVTAYSEDTSALGTADRIGVGVNARNAAVPYAVLIQSFEVLTTAIG